MRAKHVALTAFLLAPLIILVILCILIAQEIDRQNRANQRTPAPAVQNQAAGPHG